MTNQSNLNLDSILDKIKNLLELAADTPDDAEGQNAILLAQKLMLKHNVDMSQIEELSSKKDETVTTQHYQQTRVFWWQTELSVIIAKHFRCRVTRQRVYNIDYDRYETKLIFYGFDVDTKNCSKDLYWRTSLPQISFETNERCIQTSTNILSQRVLKRFAKEVARATRRIGQNEPKI